MKCERCWSQNEVEDRPRASGEPVPLCRACRDSSPSNEFLFENLFLRYATRKELLSFFETGDESEALRLWCAQAGMKVRDLRRILQLERNPMDLLSTPNPLGDLTDSVPPYGYAGGTAGPVTSALEAEVVKSVFDLYLRGWSLEKIRRMLNDGEVPAPRGGQWYRSTVRYILRNPLYAGYRRRREMLRRSSYPAIIETDLFDRAQMMLTRRCRRPEQRVQVRPLLRVI